MNKVAKALANTLLTHRLARLQEHPPGKRIIERNYTITYGDLCQRAAFPGTPQSVGRFLGEIAQWCADNDLPPINSLAVNAESGIPGESYDGAAECSIANWPAELEACVRSSEYPSRVS